jgi:DNA-binding CsgD family transcriptional regulator
LTRTQVAIVDLIAEGRTDKEIAYSVGISYRTVRTHLERLYDLNGVHCRAALTALVAQRRELSVQRTEPDDRDREGRDSRRLDRGRLDR